MATYSTAQLGAFATAIETILSAWERPSVSAYLTEVAAAWRRVFDADYVISYVVLDGVPHMGHVNVPAAQLTAARELMSAELDAGVRIAWEQGWSACNGKMLTSVVPDGQALFMETRVYRDLYAPLNILEAIAICPSSTNSRDPRIGLIAYTRHADNPTYGDDGVALAAVAATALRTAARMLAQREALPRVLTSVAEASGSDLLLIANGRPSAPQRPYGASVDAAIRRLVRRHTRSKSASARPMERINVDGFGLTGVDVAQAFPGTTLSLPAIVVEMSADPTSQHVPENQGVVARALRLTNREATVAALVGHGLTNGQIASRLGIRPSTVRHHVDALLRKLGVSGRAAAVARLTVVLKAEGRRVHGAKV